MRRVVCGQRGCCVLMAAAAAFAGCAGIENTSSRHLLIPNQTLNLSRSLSIPVESLAAGALLYAVIDPLAPNWEVGNAWLDGDRYLISLKKKRFTTGGDGEAVQIFYRRAAQLARDNGRGRYRVIEFTEGIESTVPIAQRVARGIVELVP